jgi:hypothetical protein
VREQQREQQRESPADRGCPDSLNFLAFPLATFFFYRAYVAPGGSILCADMRFMDWFGKDAAELQGKPFHSLGVEQGQLEQLVSLAAESSEAYLNSGNVAAHGVHLLHKFSNPVGPSFWGLCSLAVPFLSVLSLPAGNQAGNQKAPLLVLHPPPPIFPFLPLNPSSLPSSSQVECDVVLQLGGTETQRVLIYNIKRHVSSDKMIACDARGKVVYCTTDMASMIK